MVINLECVLVKPFLSLSPRLMHLHNIPPRILELTGADIFFQLILSKHTSDWIPAWHVIMWPRASWTLSWSLTSTHMSMDELWFSVLIFLGQSAFVNNQLLCYWLTLNPSLIENVAKSLVDMWVEVHLGHVSWHSLCYLALVNLCGSMSVHSKHCPLPHHEKRLWVTDTTPVSLLSETDAMVKSYNSVSMR